MGFVTQLIVLAAGCAVTGVIITFATLVVCQYFAIDISWNVWILAIPVLSSLFLNVAFIELYRRVRKP